MREIVKDFESLDRREIFEMYRLRVSVFVVEQRCPYQEVDETDLCALHLFLRDEAGIAAYCRLWVAAPGEARIGRVIAARRRRGLGSRVLSLALKTAKETLGAEKAVVEAQCYAASMYEKQGFSPVSDVFEEDGIPHIRMERTL